jgi:hypothetical protein
MNLTELLTTATTGTAPLALGPAAALYATVADDRRTMGLGLAPKTGDMPVTIELGEGWAEASVHNGGLRYLIDLDDDTVTRQCTTPGCNGESIGRHIITRVCAAHTDKPFLGGSQTARLDAWSEEIDDAVRGCEGDRRVIAKLREQA